MSRRKFIGIGGLGISALAVGTTFKFATDSQATAVGGTLNIPTLLSASSSSSASASATSSSSASSSTTSVYDLTMETGTTELLSGISSSTMGYNGAYLGPTIKVTKGDAVQLNITNNVGAETTTHFHGLHVPAYSDGGPMTTFASGTTWSPSFTINQAAGTFWYHPHYLGTTAYQVGHGLAGMIIIEDSTTASYLPSSYGVDEIPLIVQSVPVSSAGVIQSATAALASSSYPLMVNGANAKLSTPTLEVYTNRIRLHLLNGSMDDILTFSRTDGTDLVQVASDGGLLESPISVASIELVAGERAQIVLDTTAAITLQCKVTAGGAAGGSGTYDIVSITTSDTTTPSTLETSLNTITAYSTTSATARTITYSNNGNTMEINGVAGTTMAIMEENAIDVTLDAIEEWTIVNNTALTHSFHIHDVPFLVISVNGSAPTNGWAGWKDTIKVAADTTIKVAMQFSDYYSSEYAYMFHCHNVIHEDEGMMGMFYVLES